MTDTGEIPIGSGFAVLARWQRDAITGDPLPTATVLAQLWPDDKSAQIGADIPMTYIPGTESDFVGVIPHTVTSGLIETKFYWVKKILDAPGTPAYHDEQWETYQAVLRRGKC